MDYDVIVIGAGHAGIEAGLACSRLNQRTILITQNLDTIGKLSCNPAIGGLSKGNIVREIDALGGEMAHIIDKSMIQYRVLNKGRGPAVQAPRAQADKDEYAKVAKLTLENQKGLDLFQDTVIDLILDGKKCIGVKTLRGNTISAKAVVLTTGTFMNAKIFIGEYTALNGRIDEPSVIGLSENLEKYNFHIGRMKTGTPARIDKDSIDYTDLVEQASEDKLSAFSFEYDQVDRPKISCYLSQTNEKTHKIIQDNMDKSPLYSGEIVGKGPRYCPSIEDKVVRFKDRDKHLVYLEPEGEHTNSIYLNGISSSLPEKVQLDFIHTIKGLEKARILKPGYAVEYDYLDPMDLYPTLESIIIENLYIAGQSNGTSGYEEAAGQGLIAAINAVMKIQGEKPFILDRSLAYIGVLIDDLVTKGTTEPYRMFTSRSEHRLNQRADTCDQRLTPLGYDIGLASEFRMKRVNEKIDMINQVKKILDNNRMQSKSLSDWIRMPENSIFTLENDELKKYNEEILYQAELDIKYEGYIAREQRQVQKFKKLEKLYLKPDFDYDNVLALSTEAKEKLKKVRPLSIGQASRISGVRQSDIAVLMLALSGKKKND